MASDTASEPEGERPRWPRLRPNILLLLLGVAVAVLVTPIAIVAQLRLYSDALVHETERSLIAESVQIGESWRQRWADATGQPLDEAPLVEPENSPSGDDGSDWVRSTYGASKPSSSTGFAPVQPEIDLRKGVAPRLPPPTHFAADRSGLEWKLGGEFSSILRRAKQMNLSGARVLDAHGCVVATSGSDLGSCFEELPEVQAALRGEYEAVARHRVRDEATPPLGSMQRRGRVRVFTAMPIRFNGQVIGVVSMSRTSLDPLEALWHERHWIFAVGLSSLAILVAVSLLSARAIARPLRRLTAAAREVANGGSRSIPLFGRLAPAEVEELRLALDRMTHELASRADYVRDFAADVSHELKAPLTSIGGAAELLRDGWDDMIPEQRTRFLDNIEAATARSERLVNRLLELARIENGRSVTGAPPLPSSALLADILAPYGEHVLLDAAKAPATVTLPPEHLRSALVNLVDNAVRHGGKDPVSVIVEAIPEAETSPGLGPRPQVLISVRDSGSGISERNRSRVFERFFTTERDRGGTGLGLAIVKAIAEARGGSVSFETGPEGTTFVLAL